MQPFFVSSRNAPRYKQKEEEEEGEAWRHKERVRMRLELAQLEINTQEWGKLLVSVWLYCWSDDIVFQSQAKNSGGALK